MNAPLGDAPQSLTGLHVIDADGAKVGKVQQVYRDDATNEPEWITVRTGLFGMKETFIPLAGARRTGDELHVPHAKETIKHAPRIDADGHLDPSEEAELYRHYGMARPGTPIRVMSVRASEHRVVPRRGPVPGRRGRPHLPPPCPASATGWSAGRWRAPVPVRGRARPATPGAARSRSSGRSAPRTARAAGPVRAGGKGGRATVRGTAARGRTGRGEGAQPGDVYVRLKRVSGTSVCVAIGCPYGTP